MGASPLIILYVAVGKGQTVIAQFFRKGRTVLDDIFFEVETFDFSLSALLLGEVIVEGKGQVALAAAEIHHLYVLALEKAVAYVGHKLQIAVYLAEFIVFCLVDRAVFTHDPQFFEKIGALCGGNYVVFLTVVTALFHSLGGVSRLYLHFGEKGHMVVVALGIYLTLGENVKKTVELFYSL